MSRQYIGNKQIINRQPWISMKSTHSINSRLKGWLGEFLFEWAGRDAIGVYKDLGIQALHRGMHSTAVFRKRWQQPTRTYQYIQAIDTRIRNHTFLQRFASCSAGIRHSWKGCLSRTVGLSESHRGCRVGGRGVVTYRCMTGTIDHGRKEHGPKPSATLQGEGQQSL